MKAATTPTFIILFILLHLTIRAQVISFRDDSLMINKVWIDASTTPKELDLLLGSKHKTVKTKSRVHVNTQTPIEIRQRSLIYPTLGLCLTTYEDDSSKYSFSIYLALPTKPHDKPEKKLKKPFTGYLFIASNDLSRKTSIDAFNQMKNVSVSFQEVNHGKVTEIKGGEIFYKEDRIRLNVDVKTKEVTAVHFYHHLKE